MLNKKASGFSLSKRKICLILSSGMTHNPHACLKEIQLENVYCVYKPSKLWHMMLHKLILVSHLSRWNCKGSSCITYSVSLSNGLINLLTTNSLNIIFSPSTVKEFWKRFWTYIKQNALFRQKKAYYSWVMLFQVRDPDLFSIYFFKNSILFLKNI